MTGLSMNELIRQAARGRRDPRFERPTVEEPPFGTIGVGRGGGAAARPHRTASDVFNEQVRLAMASKRGLIQTNDFFP
jgi:hypothetical protein